MLQNARVYIRTEGFVDHPKRHDKLICLFGDFDRFYHATSQFSLPFGDSSVLLPSILSIHLTVRFTPTPPHPMISELFFLQKSLRVSNMDALMNDSVIRCALVEIQTISQLFMDIFASLAAQNSCTPLKSNMEPENHPFKKENHLNHPPPFLGFKMFVFGLLYGQNQPEPAFYLSCMKATFADTDPSTKGYVWNPAAVVVA